MSLDLYLQMPSTCPHCGGKLVGDVAPLDVWHANITHNLTGMAEEGGLYGLLWRPEENGVERAQQLIEPLETAIAAMKADPPRFEKHNAPNGWGLYEHFLPWLERLLDACEQHPACSVYACR